MNAAAGAAARSPVGIGWRAPHHAALMAERPRLDLLEVHAENHFADGGVTLAQLLAVRAHYPISLHGVGLGLASAVGIDAAHLSRLARLVERVEPCLVSEHAAFARGPVHGDDQPRHAADLLPPGHQAAAAAILARNIAQVQDRLKRPILIEHLANCLRWADDTAPLAAEALFFNALCRRSGCQLLLDLNNLWVQAMNRVVAEPAQAPLRGAASGLRQPKSRGVRATDCARAEAAARHGAALAEVCRFIDALAPDTVGQIHLAGCRPASTRSGGWLIDDHSRAVSPAVWQAYAHALAVLGPRPTVVEWDTDLPPLPRLLAQARRAADTVPRTWVGHNPAALACATGEATQLGPNRAAMDPGLALPLVATTAAIAHEAERQRCLIAALAAPVGTARAAQAEAVLAPWLAATPQDRAPALALLRAHARAQATRALAAAYPRVAVALGRRAFAAVARRHWLTHPPRGGDLGDPNAWGAALPQALADDDRLARWPWLPDLARLDAAWHHCARAADALAAADTRTATMAAADTRAAPITGQWAALAGDGAERCGIRFPPGTAVVSSAWPIATLHQAHALPGRDGSARGGHNTAPGLAASRIDTRFSSAGTATANDRASAWAALRSALSPPRAESVLVWRPPAAMQPRVMRLTPADAAFTAALLRGACMAEALDAAMALDRDWPLADWLLRAGRHAWVLEVYP